MTAMALVGDRATVDALRRALARDRVLLEVRRDAGEADWCPVTGAEPFDWDAPLPLTGAKRFFFPPCEPLLRWRGETLTEAAVDAPAIALFGLRACDLTAIAYQDRFFAGDPAYATRRERALLVGIDCFAACAGGFCRDVDAGPFSHGGFDLNLTPLGNRVVIAVGTARGRRALTAAGLALPAAGETARAALAAAEARARELPATAPSRARSSRSLRVRWSACVGRSAAASPAIRGGPRSTSPAAAGSLHSVPRSRSTSRWGDRSRSSTAPGTRSSGSTAPTSPHGSGCPTSN